jgi:hypothetical protein
MLKCFRAEADCLVTTNSQRRQERLVPLTANADAAGIEQAFSVLFVPIDG